MINTSASRQIVSGVCVNVCIGCSIKKEFKDYKSDDKLEGLYCNLPKVYASCICLV